jgi:acyl-CoA thioesterase II
VTGLDEARLEALDGLLRAFLLTPIGEDRYRAGGEPGRFDRTFGGQLVAQALLAACASAPGSVPASVHATFVAGGAPGEAVELVVRRTRDGRSTASRHVELVQGERVLLSMLATLAPASGAPELVGSEPPRPIPDGLPQLQDWVAHVPDALRSSASTWVDTPPPIEMRIDGPTTFLGGEQRPGPRVHWMRVPADVGDDPLLHAALLAYASDFLLLDMAFRSHPEPFTSGRLQGTSADHAIWFHGPVRFDRWHRCTQETIALAGDRALVRGTIHDEAGSLVASVAQEVLVRVRKDRPHGEG